MRVATNSAMSARYSDHFCSSLVSSTGAGGGSQYGAFSAAAASMLTSSFGMTVRPVVPSLSSVSHTALAPTSFSPLLGFLDARRGRQWPWFK